MRLALGLKFWLLGFREVWQHRDEQEMTRKKLKCLHLGEGGGAEEKERESRLKVLYVLVCAG